MQRLCLAQVFPLLLFLFLFYIILFYDFGEETSENLVKIDGIGRKEMTLTVEDLIIHLETRELLQ